MLSPLHQEIINELLSSNPYKMVLKDGLVSTQAINYLHECFKQNNNVKIFSIEITTAYCTANKMVVELGMSFIEALNRFLKNNRTIIGLELGGVTFVDSTVYGGISMDIRTDSYYELYILLSTNSSLRYFKFSDDPGCRYQKLGENLYAASAQNRSLLFLDIDNDKFSKQIMNSIELSLSRNLYNINGILNNLGINFLPKEMDPLSLIKPGHTYSFDEELPLNRPSLINFFSKLTLIENDAKTLRSNIDKPPIKGQLQQLELCCSEALDQLRLYHAFNFQRIHAIGEIDACLPLEVLCRVFYYLAPSDVNHSKTNDSSFIKAILEQSRNAISDPLGFNHRK